MKAAVFKGAGKLVFEDRPKPSIQTPDEVLLKVRGIGICGTDLHILDVPPKHPAVTDIILGHEYTGEVEEVGSGVKEFKKGDCVLIDPHPPCGVCSFCREDRPDRCINLYYQHDYPIPEYVNHCKTRGIFSDGAMTSYTVVPQNSIFKISEKVPFEIAALAEPLSCVICAIYKLNIKPGDTVCVLGAGPIGLLFTSLAKSAGAAKVIVSEPVDYRRDKARKCGATRIVNPLKENLKKIIEEETDADGIDHCIEAVGAELATCIDLIRNGGKVLQFGHDETAELKIKPALIVRKEAEIHGAFIGKYTFKRTVKILESGILPLQEIVTHKMPLSQVHKAIDMLRKGEGIKIVLYPDEA